MTLLKATAAAVTLAACAGAASAKTVTLEASADGLFGEDNLSQFVTRELEGSTSSIYAGAFHFTDGLQDFIAFCIEPHVSLDLDSPFETGTNPLSEDTMVLVDQLYAVGYEGALDSASAAAAFQVALWEIIAETDVGLDVNDGNHVILAPSSVADDANLLLAGLANAGPSGFTFTTLVHDGQDQITISPIPLPAGILGLLTALAGLGALKRRRATAG